MIIELNKIRIGGLYRCCIKHISELPNEFIPHGTVITCAYCKKPTMIVAEDGIIEWSRAEG